VLDFSLYAPLGVLRIANLDVAAIPCLDEVHAAGRARIPCPFDEKISGCTVGRLRIGAVGNPMTERASAMIVIASAESAAEDELVAATNHCDDRNI